MTIPLAKFQKEFAAALTAANPKAAPDFLSNEAQARFRIYRNNYFASLSRRLAEVFPATKYLLGESEFDRLVYGYAAASPPKARSLACFGEEFLDVVKEIDDQEIPYLCDLTRLECAAHQSLNAADAEPLAPKDLIALGYEVADMRFTLHPAASVLRVDYGVHACWKDVLSGKNPCRKPIIKQPSGVLISRPKARVMTTPITLAETLFLQNLASAQTPAEALRNIDPSGELLDVTKLFKKAFVAGAFCNPEVK